MSWIDNLGQKNLMGGRVHYIKSLWNELYLSQKLTMADDKETKQALLTIIRNGPTLIWHYVNLHGVYDFTQDIEEQKMLFDMDKIRALKVA